MPSPRPELRLDPAYVPSLPRHPRPIVVLGAGGIVRDAHLPAYEKGGLPVAAIADVRRDRAEALADRFSVPAVHGSVEEAVAAAPADAVYDLALMPEHFASALAALPDGAPVLIQKPLGHDLATGLALVELCHRRRLVAAVNTQLRFAPYIAAARRLIADGAIGELVDLEVRVTVETDWTLFPAVLTLDRLELNMHSVHYLDLVRSFLGDPDSVSATTVPHPSKALANTRTDVILRYRDRPIRVVVSTNHDHAFGDRHQESFVKWEGTGGAIRAQMGLLLDYPVGGRDELEIVRAGSHEWEPVPFEGSWFPDAFIGSMSCLQRYVEGSIPTLPTSVDDVIRTMRVVEAAHRSQEVEGIPLDAVELVR